MFWPIPTEPPSKHWSQEFSENTHWVEHDTSSYAALTEPKLEKVRARSIKIVVTAFINFKLIYIN